MSKFIITGEKKLQGSIPISGAKNAALKILVASIMANTESTILNVPDIVDIRKILGIIESIGAKVTYHNNTATIDPKNVNDFEPDSDLIKKLRGSIVMVGPLLSKFGKAVIAQPGGCLIGARPVDDHIDVFKQLGIRFSQKGDKLIFSGKPKASEITLNKLSVTATENAIMATIFAEGTTKIHVAACEPEIVDLADYLNKMGAKIKGAGTHEITIEGVSSLKGVKHSVIPDRVEAGTYLIASIATNSSVKIGPIIPNHLNIVLKKLKDMGANFSLNKAGDFYHIETKPSKSLLAQSIDTRTYPGFPTDLQSPFVVLATQAKGVSQIFETLFEGRFLFLEELQIMGAKTEILSPYIINVTGPTKLKGGNIISRDLRGGAALVIAALLAKGTTTIDGIDYVDRGYEKMDEKLKNVGAEIQRIE